MSHQGPKIPQGELADAFTGETFTARSRNHYEENDGVPVAPAVDTPRPTVRQRVENLTRQGRDPLSYYVGTEGIDMDVPEDGDAPLTQSEQNYIDVLAAEVAEAAPLPDDGLPRLEPSAVPAPPRAPEPVPAGVSSPPQATPKV